MSNTIKNIILERFYPLVKEYGFKKISGKIVSGGFEAYYENDFCGVSIVYEFKEAYLFIKIFRLIDGKKVKNSNLINDDTVFNCHSLDDLISLLCPQRLLKPAYQYPQNHVFNNAENGLTAFVDQFAKNLFEFATPFFLGDFDLFQKLNPMVIERVKKYKNQK